MAAASPGGRLKQPGAGALMALGALLLVLSITLVGYTRFVEWQHSVAVQSAAPPPEVLANRLPLPTPRP